MNQRERAYEEYNKLYRLSESLYHDIAVRMGLSDSAFDILYYLRTLGDGCLQKDVCDASCLSKQTVNSSVHKLVREGVITLASEHGRGMHLHLTKRGQAMVEKRIDPVIEAEKEAFACLTPSECDQLIDLTQRYLDRLSNLADNLTHTEGGQA